jgi:hypothetical protein
LENSSVLYPEGDNVQVIATWTPPSAFEGITLDVITALFTALRKGPGQGEFYSPDRRSKRWAGTVIAKIADILEEDAARILRTWLANGVLLKDQYDSPERRESVIRVIVNESKAADILGPLYAPPEPEG